MHWKTIIIDLGKALIIGTNFGRINIAGLLSKPPICKIYIPHQNFQPYGMLFCNVDAAQAHNDEEDGTTGGKLVNGALKDNVMTCVGGSKAFWVLYIA